MVFLINLIFAFIAEVKSQDWTAKRFLLHHKTSSRPSPPVSCSAAHVSGHDGVSLQEFSKQVRLGRHRQRALTEVPSSLFASRRREVSSHTYSSSPDRSTLTHQNYRSDQIKAQKRRADEMERRAKDAEYNLALTLQQLSEAHVNIAALEAVVERERQENAKLQQQIQILQANQQVFNTEVGNCTAVSDVLEASDTHTKDD